MSVRFYSCTYDAATPAAEEFCQEFQAWLDASYVRADTAVDKLCEQFVKAGLTEVDSFTIHFRGDFSQSWTSKEVAERELAD